VRTQSLVFNTLSDVLKLDPRSIFASVRQRRPGRSLDPRVSFGQTLILLNGQRLNDAQSGHHNMDIPVPLESISVSR